jgi:hypothetical protein
MLETARTDDKQEGIKIAAGKFDTWLLLNNACTESKGTRPWNTRLLLLLLNTVLRIS